MACLHTHMFATCLITCLVKRYQFTGRDMPLQKPSGVAILVSLQECGFIQPRTVHRDTNSVKPQVKIRFAFHFVERNDFQSVLRSLSTLNVYEHKTSHSTECESMLFVANHIPYL